MEKDRLDFKIKVRIKKGEDMFGPGLIEFLERTAATGSMQAACEQMEMSYSKGWRLLKAGEKATGKVLLDRKSGGSSHGSSTLTEDGKRLIEDYKAFTALINKAASESFDSFFGKWQGDEH